ncbi:Dynein heavy chain family protein [Tritrichomonas foetus]|uniref:Dynein heavy chain family protein n=1 Tax=Tritrichomonas foetus TaxID=1144522 RepID=A0A1J4KNQ6_9EUKA|nr:Dynein heavy chain family protein [Tritrichomonas foetus]|eukprot:OHT12762.1 Dynein heavy chain family protein [Tritrichomonas foetus]
MHPIFTGTSIQQKLHREARDWHTVDKTWASIMNLTHNHPDFTNVMHRDNLLRDLKKSNELLESITQGLNAYLESKRHGFPRFFFLSNDELIAILSHSKDFDQIQKSMNKLFEYVQSINVEDGSLITAMNDDGLESVRFENPVDGDTHEIEDWLNAFEEEMKNTLKEQIKISLQDYPKKKKDEWIGDYPAQVVLIANQILWTQQVTQSLKTKSLRQVTLLQQKFIEGLNLLTSMVRQQLSHTLRQVISCLLINEVHNRDIISSLIKQEVTDPDSFKWQVQLRYYWEDETVIVKSINNVFEYSYEYAGNSARLVITPLTDICYQTLLSSFKQNLSGAPSGPAGTGKTETVRDCAKALGRPCVVYNCSEEVTPEQMSQFFAGLSSSGSWSCFDEFNRINIEVLSVIAQQVRTIQNAIAASVETFVLDERTLKLNKNAAICITMNPGYAGRTELPDNLKALFRPCAMMVPDFVFISEILLFSGGFTNASSLSVKLVALFDLCRTQLSKAHHYDWGMRAMKSILTTAAKAKRNDLDKDESLLLVNSIRDCTRPRLVSADIILVDNIIHDVFPDVQSEKILPESVQKYLIKAFESLNCQPLPTYLRKSYELYETTMLRHGLMLVGGPMGGKTVSWKALTMAMCEMAKDNANTMAIHVDTLNPKSISIPELYGLFDPVTSGWSDGVLSSKIRDCSMSDPTEYKWIIVDGPVDSLWIETMNSLLDDNKVLCLSNNERIALGNHVKMVFEVDDLSQASPATVSRCGMVYFDPSTLPYNVIVESYLNSVENEKLREFLKDKLETFVPKLIDFVENKGKVIIGHNPLFMLRNMFKLLTCFNDILREPIIQESPDGEEVKEIDPLNDTIYFSLFRNHEHQTIDYIKENFSLFEQLIVFCSIWSFGANLNDDSRIKFSDFIKAECSSIPTEKIVYEYFYNLSTQKWEEWCDGKTGCKITEGKPLESQLVPTNETAPILFLSRLLVNHEVHMLLSGAETCKTLAVKTLTTDILEQKFDCRNLPFANCSTSINVLKVLRSFMQKRHGCYGPLDNQKLVIFLDNINSVRPEIYGAQPPLELIRQFFDYGGWYDTSKVEFQHVVETTILAAMGEPGGGLYSLSERLLRHFFYITIPKYSPESMEMIVNNLLKNHLENYSSDIQSISPKIAKASIEIYEKCVQNLLPTPGKSHYIFSLRNLVRVLKGMMMCPSNEMKTAEDFTNLWAHEVMREFYDRFNSLEDRSWFLNVLNTSMKSTLSKNYQECIFTDYIENSSSYHQTKLSIDEILSHCREVLQDHNHDTTKPLDIVLFKEAVGHITALTRALSMERGHGMLVGVKSSGRKSLARLALHMASMEVFEVQITRTYGFNEWRDDMKNLMKQCGSSDLPTGFIISDAQIIGSFQLEDISNLLINGEIPNLFERDEMEQIKADIVQAELLTDEDPWKLFKERIHSHLHLILVFSPFGTVFKESILSYPALRTETTIDWYMPWSSDALESVASASLEKVNLGEDRLLKAVVSVCVKIHKSVEKMASLFLKEQKRFTACTPSRYFELISTFISKLSEKRKTTTEDVKKYLNGVDKIKATRKQIEELSRQLDHDMPILQQKRKQVEEMLLDLQVKKGEVEDTQKQVKEQSQLAEVEAAAAKKTNRIAQKKLQAAQPILQAAQDAVDSMDRDSLVNIKTLKKVHPALRETFDAICIIFGRNPRKVDSGVPGVKEDDYWPETLSLLNDSQFIKKVKMFEIEKLSRDTINKLKKYVGQNKKEREEKRSAVESGYIAAANLYNWVCASYDYWYTYQEILPKKIQAEEAAAKLAKSEKILQQRRQHLQAVEDQLQKLIDKVDEEQRNEQSLAESVESTKLRLKRAEEIMKGLSGETKRWSECANSLKESSLFILGDSLLISAALTHLGAFGPTYRALLIDEWKEFLNSEQIKFSNNFSISSALGNDPTIRDWIVRGLPNDSHSIENALIIENATKSFPLLIDPQLSGTKWLCSILGEKIVILRFDQSDFLQRMRSCVQFGIPVLIENIGLKLDPLIDPILLREIFLHDGVKKIALGGEYVSISDDFRLYLSTKYPNPHYSPEICSQVTLINFTTTPTGLTDLLMNNLIEVEQEELDKMRISIMEKNAINTKKLKDVENEILQIVSNAGSDILDDDTAIDTLKRAQVTSADIEQQMEASKQTEKLISDFRETYISVAERAALLYFCASDFSVVDPMYQFSLKWFVSLFKTAISKAEHSEDKTELIDALNTAIATQFFQSVSFSLFSRHKLLFSTLMATRVLVAEKHISTAELAFLLSPSMAKKPKEIDFVADEAWPLLVSLENISPAFNGIIKHINNNRDTWKAYIELTEPENGKIPLDNLTPFQKLLILRVFHLHRVREGLRLFVSETLGKEFVTPPPLNLANVFKESNPLSPLIFIITPGIDPVDEVTEVATSMDLEKYLRCYSLGRGRGDGAEQLILDSAEKGYWLMLQNCHLSLSWMPRLEYLIDHMDPTKTSDRFRLCLVTMSDDRFPIGILYQGSKLIYEIPKGIRENMLRIYSGMNIDEYINDYTDTERQLTFHLAFYHSVVLERLQFGSIGWNIPYEFNPSDLMISRKHLRTFLNEAGPTTIPFEALTYVIGELNYGGRVTDPLDRRLLLSLLNRYFSEEIKKPRFSFGPRYPIPKFDDELEDVLDLISTWPIVTEGEDVGLSMNASTITARNDALSIFNSLIEIQPILVAASGEVSEEQFALNLVDSLLNEIPEQFDIKSFEKNFDLTDTINTVLHHEIILYNELLNLIKSSLIVLQKGLKGLIVFDEKLELLNRRLLANKVPEIWLEKSFPSILTLHSYITDLRHRVKFMRQWCEEQERPKIFKLGAFFHPEEFTTAILQVYARKNKVSFDSLHWTTKIAENGVTDVEEGILVDSLFLEGAKYDNENQTLIECGQRELISQLPVIHFLPTQKEEENTDNIYVCPLYRMQNRGSGALGLPNHILDLQIPSKNVKPDHWIQRSVAVFLTIQT